MEEITKRLYMKTKINKFTKILLDYSEDIVHLGIIFLIPHVAWGSFLFFTAMSLYVWYKVYQNGISFYTSTYSKRIDDIYNNPKTHFIVLSIIYALYAIFAIQYSNIIPYFVSIPYVILVSSHDFFIILFIKKIWSLKQGLNKNEKT